jgi:hypothetical protein
VGKKSVKNFLLEFFSMKSFLFIFSLFILLMNSLQAKIINREGVFFLGSGSESTPIIMLNELIQQKKVSQIILYAQGSIHLLSFAKEGEKPKLYSVDAKGFIYALDPYMNYDVSKVNSNGTFEFKQRPGLSYHVSSKGFYLHEK